MQENDTTTSKQNLASQSSNPIKISTPTSNDRPPLSDFVDEGDDLKAQKGEKKNNSSSPSGEDENSSENEEEEKKDEVNNIGNTEVNKMPKESSNLIALSKHDSNYNSSASENFSDDEDQGKIIVLDAEGNEIEISPALLPERGEKRLLYIIEALWFLIVSAGMATTALSADLEMDLLLKRIDNNYTQDEIIALCIGFWSAFGKIALVHSLSFPTVSDKIKSYNRGGEAKPYETRAENAQRLLNEQSKQDKISAAEAYDWKVDKYVVSEMVDAEEEKEYTGWKDWKDYENDYPRLSAALEKTSTRRKVNFLFLLLNSSPAVYFFLIMNILVADRYHKKIIEMQPGGVRQSIDDAIQDYDLKYVFAACSGLVNIASSPAIGMAALQQFENMVIKLQGRFLYGTKRGIIKEIISDIGGLGLWGIVLYAYEESFINYARYNVWPKYMPNYAITDNLYAGDLYAKGVYFSMAQLSFFTVVPLGKKWTEFLFELATAPIRLLQRLDRRDMLSLAVLILTGSGLTAGSTPLIFQYDQQSETQQQMDWFILAALVSGSLLVEFEPTKNLIKKVGSKVGSFVALPFKKAWEYCTAKNEETERLTNSVRTGYNTVSTSEPDITVIGNDGSESQIEISISEYLRCCVFKLPNKSANLNSDSEDSQDEVKANNSPRSSMPCGIF